MKTYKNKSIRDANRKRFQLAMQELNQSTEIDMANPPNPYDLIRQENKQAEKNGKANGKQTQRQTEPSSHQSTSHGFNNSHTGYAQQSKVSKKTQKYEEKEQKGGAFWERRNNNWQNNRKEHVSNAISYDNFESLFEDQTESKQPVKRQNPSVNVLQSKSLPTIPQRENTASSLPGGGRQSEEVDYFKNFRNGGGQEKPKTSRAREIFDRKKSEQNGCEGGFRNQRVSFRPNKSTANLKECEKGSQLTTVEALHKKKATVRNYNLADPRFWQSDREIEDCVLYGALRNFPHIKEFKNDQKAIIKCALKGNDTFICIPTGGGKSLIFQILTFIRRGVYLCILPLVSLIYDQEQQALQYNIEAYSLTGGTSKSETLRVYNKLRGYDGEQNSILLLCTPEKIGCSQAFSEILDELYRNGFLRHVIIDEVHCVSTWGKEFRHEYKRLSLIKEKFPKAPVLGLTATVTEAVKQEIINNLNLRNCMFFQSSFNRSNLHYEVRSQTRDSMGEICRILDSHEGESGIIYCLSRKNCEKMSQDLNQRRYKTAFYHAEISDKQKREIQEQWMNDRVHIIIATIAFGMGINKPNVRFVIHNSLSKSLENYYQESGRAGRDGKVAKCVLFYSRSDRTALQSMNLGNSYSSSQAKNFGNRQLAQMVKYCEEKFMCRRQFQLSYLGETNFDPRLCNKTCDNCMRGRQFKEYECIEHAKELIKFLKDLHARKERITKVQLKEFCIKKNPKKAFSYVFEEQMRALFKDWADDELQQLVLDLLTEEVLTETVVKSSFGKREITNIYIQDSPKMSSAFLSRVQSFPQRREFRGEEPRNKEKEFRFLFDDSEEEEDCLQKQMETEALSRKEDIQKIFDEFEYEHANERRVFRETQEKKEQIEIEHFKEKPKDTGNADYLLSLLNDSEKDPNEQMEI